MREIHFNSKYGQFVTMVDDEDYDWLSEYKWRLLRGGRTNYVQTHVDVGPNRMHRMIYAKHFGILETDLIDHKDRNGLNNQSSNLRVCNYSQNGANIDKQDSVAASQFKGVTLQQSGGWYARIKYEQQYICIGVFTLERDAAIAYDIEATRLFGDFAKINVPDASESDIKKVIELIANPKRKRLATSKYLGVFKRVGGPTWGFNAFHDKRNHQVSGFTSELDAAIARDNYINTNDLPIRKSLTL